ncbi:hypothetical protein DPMN_154157 [Dreissena polymorpha]|uniref:Uncharacterized protein n=1 Tax=Dreissena polymorpha TaxID=45954 RepID=A0A9D4J8V4_DREPO|nr:hypothetical protein DPMN_154157 [Dreissena polymorpha]
MNPGFSNSSGFLHIQSPQLRFPSFESRNIDCSTHCPNTVLNVEASVSQNNITWYTFFQNPTSFCNELDCCFSTVCTWS